MKPETAFDLCAAHEPSRNGVRRSRGSALASVEGAEELPAGMRLTDVEDMPVKYLNGRYMVRNHVDTNRRTLSFFLSTPARLLCSTRRACVFSLSLFCIAVASFFITRVGNDWPFGHN